MEDEVVGEEEERRRRKETEKRTVLPQKNVKLSVAPPTKEVSQPVFSFMIVIT